MPFRPAAGVGSALQAIVADPAHGPAVLSDGRLLGHLLSDYLPDAHREARILVAAADAGLPDRLREQAASGVDVAAAIRLAASSFEATSGFSAPACEWAAGQLAVALGMAAAGHPAGPSSAVVPPAQAETRTWRPPDQQAQPISQQAPAFPANQYQAAGGQGFAAPQPAPSSARSRRPAVIVGVAAGVAALAVAGAALAVVSGGHGGGSASPPATVVIGQFTGSKPTTIIFSGDGSSSVNHIHWSSWSASRAVGTGTWNEETCVPDCATGPVDHYPASLTFSSASNGKFTELITNWNGQTTTWTYPQDWPQQAAG